MTDFADWNAPQAHATAIATTGAPLLGFKTILGSNAAGLAIGAGNSANLVSARAAGQVGYEISLSVSTLAVTASAVTISVKWFDTATGLLTDTQNWTFFAGSVSRPHNVRITGPSNGDQVTIAATAGANAITIAFTVMQTSRVYTRHSGHTLTLNFGNPTIPGFTFASGDASSGILCAESQVVTNSGSTTLILPLYSGTARFWGRASDTTGTNSEWRLGYRSELIIVNDNFPYIGLGGQGFSPDGAGSFEIDNVAMPRTQMTLQLLNHNTTASNTMEADLITREIAA